MVGLNRLQVSDVCASVRSPWVWLLLLVALCVLPSRHARAEVEDFRLAGVSALRVDGAPKLLQQETDIECDAVSERCLLHARWSVPASTSPREAVVYVAANESATVEIDGEVADHHAQYTNGDGQYYGAERFSFVVPPTRGPATVVLEVRFDMEDHRTKCAFGMSFGFFEVRHSTQRRTTYLVHLDLTAPDEQDPPATGPPSAPRIRMKAPRGWTLRDRGPSLYHAEDRRLLHGPIIGAGVRLHAGTKRPWLRGGWEFMSLPFMAHTVAVESDLRRMLVVPTTEIGTPASVFLPSLSLGAGLPVRVFPKARVGVRTVASLNFWLVSITGAYDVFPATGGDALEHVGRVGVQFSI